MRLFLNDFLDIAVMKSFILLKESGAGVRSQEHKTGSRSSLLQKCGALVVVLPQYAHTHLHATLLWQQCYTIQEVLQEVPGYCHPADENANLL